MYWVIFKMDKWLTKKEDITQTRVKQIQITRNKLINKYKMYYWKEPVAREEKQK
jgi:hypothetical protein